jgi:hypothetical protein
MAECPHPRFVVDIHENAEVMQVLLIPEVVDVQTLGTGHREPPAHPELQKAVRPENSARKVAQTRAEAVDLLPKSKIKHEVGAECVV